MSYHSLRKALGNCVKNVDQGFTNRVNSKGEPAKHARKTCFFTSGNNINSCEQRKAEHRYNCL